MSIRELILPMANDLTLKQLAVDGGLRWDFSEGYAPLWLRGNWREPHKVRLVLLLAEPSSPDFGESFSTDAETWFSQIALPPEDCPPFGTIRQNRAFQKKFEWFLGNCGFDLSQHQNVWSEVIVTNTFWLRLPDKFQQAPQAVEDYFLQTYLRPILLQLPNAKIVGAGGKAHRRLSKSGIPFIPIGALAPPGCYQKKVVALHEEVASSLRAVFFGSQELR